MRSPLEQFIVFADEAEKYRAQQEYASCLPLLRKGLTIYSKGKKIVDALLIEIEKSVDPTTYELKELALKVKQQIKALINDGNLVKAAMLIDELSDIVPDDLETIELRAQIQKDDVAILWH